MWVKCTNLKFTAPGMFVYLILVSPPGLWYRTLPTLFRTYDSRFPGWYSSSGFSLAVTSSTKTALLPQHLVTTALLCFSFNWSFTCQLFFLDYELLFWRFQMTHVTSCAALCLCLSIFQVKLYSPTLASSEKPRILCNIQNQDRNQENLIWCSARFMECFELSTRHTDAIVNFQLYTFLITANF